MFFKSLLPQWSAFINFDPSKYNDMKCTALEENIEKQILYYQLFI